MPKIITPLTDTQVKNARHQPQGSNKLYDGGGLYLELTKSGGKLWKMKSIFNGKENTLSFGQYPVVGLAQARQYRADAQKLKASGIDPARARQATKQAQAAAASNTFEAIARMWHANELDRWKANTAEAMLHRLQKDVFPAIGSRPITELKAPELIPVFKKMEQRGAAELAKRVAQLCSRVFKFAEANGLCEHDPIPAMRKALKPRVRSHHAAITVDELPGFIADVVKHEPNLTPSTRILLRLMMMTFLRTSELIEAPWSEIDMQNRKWVIPWHRMKMGKRKVNPRKVDHHVFLPTQGWELLNELHAITGNGEYVFPNARDKSKPASTHCILQALKRMGYRGRMTAHGFRSLAMGAIKRHLGYRHEVIDRQLAHQSGDIYGEAYDREDFRAERQIMMQAYADLLADIEHGRHITSRNVVPLRGQHAA